MIAANSKGKPDQRPARSRTQSRQSPYLDSAEIDQAVTAFSRIHDTLQLLPSVHAPGEGESDLDPVLHRNVLPDIRWAAQYIPKLRKLLGKIESDLARMKSAVARIRSQIPRINERKTRDSLRGDLIGAEDELKKILDIRKRAQETLAWGEKLLARAQNGG